MALTKVQADGINLADTFAFSGTVSGTEANTPSFLASRTSSNQTITASTWTKIQFNDEIYDNGGVYDHATNYRFTPNVAGKYYCFCNINPNTATTHTYGSFYFNGTGHFPMQIADGSQSGGVTLVNTIIFNGSSDYLEAYTYQGTGAGRIEDSSQFNIFGAYRIIGA
jgi:hypothetical protein